MTKGLKIAIGGKGGVGKTTVCAVWSHLFAEDGFSVMAVDADPNVTLASAFGISPQSRPMPLIEMKTLIAERTGTAKDSLGLYFKMNPRVSDLPAEYSIPINRDGVKLLVLGGITQAGGGCACPEGAFLKAMLSHAVLQRDELVLVDLAAGVESMGRASILGIDALVVVVEAGGASIETANSIAAMASDLGIKTVAAVANKITDPAQKSEVASRLRNVSLLGTVNYDPAVQRADLAGKPAYPASRGLVDSLRKAKDDLMRMLKSAESVTV